MDVESRLGLIKDMMGCAVCEQPTHDTVTEMKCLCEIRNRGSLLWEIFCDAEPDDRMDA